MVEKSITIANGDYLTIHGITPEMQSKIIALVLHKHNLDESVDTKTLEIILDSITAGVVAYRKIKLMGVR